MSHEENKELTRRAYEALNRRDWAAFDELAAADIVLHYASMTIQGLEAYKQFLTMYYNAFPDLQFTIEDMIAEEDMVVVRQTGSGTHQGELMGIPPTGKHVTVSGIAMIRISNGNGVEEWFIGDDLGLLQQLGVVPAPG